MEQNEWETTFQVEIPENGTPSGPVTEVPREGLEFPVWIVAGIVAGIAIIGLVTLC